MRRLNLKFEIRNKEESSQALDAIHRSNKKLFRKFKNIEDQDPDHEVKKERYLSKHA